MDEDDSRSRSVQNSVFRRSALSLWALRFCLRVGKVTVQVEFQNPLHAMDALLKASNIWLLGGRQYKV